MMSTIWAFMGYGLIASGVFAWLLNQSPFMEWLEVITPPIAGGINYYATSLEIIIPVGLFLVISQPNPRSLGLALGVAVAAGLALWGLGF